VQIPVHNLAGEVIKNIEISDAVFAVPFNQAVVHQAVVRQQANARQGTVDTKTRADIAGSGRKLFRQKHTGRARAGTRKSPLRRGGGVVFGPHPRSYRQAMPKKMRRLALRCALSAKVEDGELKVVEALQLDQPKTREMAQILKALGLESSALIVTEQMEESLVKSARNLSRVKTTPAALLNTLDVLSCKVLLITEAAVRRVEELWGGVAQGGKSSASV